MPIPAELNRLLTAVDDRRLIPNTDVMVGDNSLMVTYKIPKETLIGKVKETIESNSTYRLMYKLYRTAGVLPTPAGPLFYFDPIAAYDLVQDMATPDIPQNNLHWDSMKASEEFQKSKSKPQPLDPSSSDTETL